MFAIGVCDKNLAEIFATHHFNNFFDAAGVQFVENIVEEQQGFPSDRICQEIILRKPEGNSECLCLALRGCLFNGHTVERKNNVVAMRPDGSVFQNPVAPGRCLESLGQRFVIFA